MFAQSLCILLAVGAIAASPLESGWVPPYKGVDPNSLACDPAGLEFLLLPHFSECNKYFICNHGREVEQNCAGGTIFDFEEQTCNWDWATKCWLRELEDAIDGSGDGEVEWEAQADAAVVAPEPVVNFHPTLDCARADSASRQLAYRGDCQRFWRCSGASLQSAYCSDGLFFNAQTQMCDFEANVRCDVTVEDELTGEFIVYH